jgi:hypothetical protein
MDNPTTPRDGAARHVIEIEFADRDEAEMVYDYIEESMAVLEMPGTLSMRSGPDARDAARLPLNKDPESWVRVSVGSVIGGSYTQIGNVLHMALQDIATLDEMLAARDAALRKALIENETLRDRLGALEMVSGAARDATRIGVEAKKLVGLSLSLWSAIAALRQSLSRLDAAPAGAARQLGLRDRPELTALIQQSIASYNAMTPAQKDEMHKAQAASWARGNIALDRMERDEARTTPARDLTKWRGAFRSGEEPGEGWESNAAAERTRIVADLIDPPDALLDAAESAATRESMIFVGGRGEAMHRVMARAALGAAAAHLQSIENAQPETAARDGGEGE